METLITYLITIFLIALVFIPYYLKFRSREKKAKKKYEELKISGLQAARSLHPHINALACIGCGACVAVCPEGDVLAVFDGKATLIHGAKCIGHGLCADACPVGAITLLMAKPGRSADFPILDESFQTSLKGVYIAGELGGLGLIKNAVLQGSTAVESIRKNIQKSPAEYDVAIVGAGPAGLTAGLTAKKHNLKYILFEQGDIGGTILHYPRRKIVLTSPVEIPLWGKLKLREVSKESLLEVWEEILLKTNLTVNINEKVVDIERVDGYFRIGTPKQKITAGNIVLALGRRGTPRKLGVPGEDLSKVMYQLIDAETYKNCDVLIVGGGDSAVEAAVGLATHGTNRITISYRKSEFGRIKERNNDHLKDFIKRDKLKVVFESEVKEITADKVNLQTLDGLVELKNDYVLIFAGGELPYEFLKKIGISFQTQVIQ